MPEKPVTYSAFGDSEAVKDLLNGKTPMAFQGELMICVVCGRIEQSKPDHSSNWRAIDINGKRDYACPNEFPPDDAPAEAFTIAYKRLLKFASTCSASDSEKSPNRNKLGRLIAPGIWEDAEGNPHFCIPELLALVKLGDTLENRQKVTATLRKMIHDANPNAPIVERKTLERLMPNDKRSGTPGLKVNP